jgi:Na+/melibiose symporter-like transporter
MSTNTSQSLHILCFWNSILEFSFSSITSVTWAWHMETFLLPLRHDFIVCLSLSPCLWCQKVHKHKSKEWWKKKKRWMWEVNWSICLQVLFYSCSSRKYLLTCTFLIIFYLTCIIIIVIVMSSIAQYVDMSSKVIVKGFVMWREMTH